MLGTRSVRLLAALVMAAAAPALGQNLFPDGEFDAGAQIDDWALLRGTDHGIDNGDSDLCSDSGSLWAVSAARPEGEPEAFEVILDGPCVPIAGTPVYTSMRYNSADATELAFSVTFYASPECTELVERHTHSLQTPTGAAWRTVLRGPYYLFSTTPPQSLRFTVKSASPLSQPHVLRVDRLYAGYAERVFADDFEGGEICRWAGSAPP